MALADVTLPKLPTRFDRVLEKVRLLLGGKPENWPPSGYKDSSTRDRPDDDLWMYLRPVKIIKAQ